MRIDTGGPAFPSTRMNGQEEGMTLRQYAAIKLRVPNSGTKWLDDMIRTSLLNDFAAKAMQGKLSACEDYYAPDLASFAFDAADAMLKAGEA